MNIFYALVFNIVLMVNCVSHPHPNGETVPHQHDSSLKVPQEHGRSLKLPREVGGLKKRSHEHGNHSGSEVDTIIPATVRAWISDSCADLPECMRKASSIDSKIFRRAECKRLIDQFHVIRTIKIESELTTNLLTACRFLIDQNIDNLKGGPSKYPRTFGTLADALGEYYFTKKDYTNSYYYFAIAVRHNITLPQSEYSPTKSSFLGLSKATKYTKSAEDGFIVFLNYSATSNISPREITSQLIDSFFDGLPLNCLSFLSANPELCMKTDQSMINEMILNFSQNLDFSEAASARSDLQKCINYLLIIEEYHSDLDLRPLVKNFEKTPSK